MNEQARDNRRKPVIGVAGGIASGKTLVATMLGDLGAGVISADDLNHEVLHRDDVRRRVQANWGADTYDADGRLNRRRLAEIVFADPAQKEKLERLTHPLVDELREQWTNRYQADPGITMIVMDVPLLFEVRQDALCDTIIFVEADHQVRAERAGRQRGWQPGELDRREKLQNPLDIKRKQSDYVVQNNSDIDTLRRSVENIYQQLVASF